MYSGGLICERCKKEQAIFNCQECQPFHLFCQRCDSAVHSLSIKRGHERNLIYQQNQQSPMDRPGIQRSYAPNCCPCHTSPRRRSDSPYAIQDDDIDDNQNYRDYSPISQYKHNSNSVQMSPFLLKNNIQTCRTTTHKRTNTCPKVKMGSNFASANTTYETLPNNINSEGNNNDSIPFPNRNTFTKDYVNEIKSIHEKEKNELLYKIKVLEHSLDRLKLKFQLEMQKLKEESESKAVQHSQEKEELIKKTEESLNEKDSKIDTLIKDNENIQKMNYDLLRKIDENKKLTEENSENYNNQIETLKKEIKKLKEQAHSNIQDLTQRNKEEIDNILYEKNIQSEKAQRDINLCKNEISRLEEENEALQIRLNDAKNRIGALKNENGILKENCKQYDYELNIKVSDNESMRCKLEQVQKINNTMSQDFDFLEKSVAGLKQEILMLKDNNTKKEKDYQILLLQSEKIRKEFSSRMFDVSDIQIYKIITYI